MTDLSTIHIYTAMTVALAESICGKLSHTTKMPCPSYSLPTERCVTGAKLSLIENSVCSKCYAKKGNHRFHTGAQEERWQSLKHPRWVEAITHLIREEANPHFRWHDSGDLAGYQHLQKIIDVANALPAVSFWLPTSERDIVHEYRTILGEFPKNLIVRVSTTLIDSSPRKDQSHTSSVHRDKPPYGFACRAPQQGNKCLTCRACWDKSIKNTSFHYHWHEPRRFLYRQAPVPLIQAGGSRGIEDGPQGRHPLPPLPLHEVRDVSLRPSRRADSFGDPREAPPQIQLLRGN